MEPHEVNQLRTHLQGVWERTHNKWRYKIDPWIQGTVEIWPKGVDRSQTIPAKARAIIEHASDTQLVWEPRFHRNPVGRGDPIAREEDADAVEGGLSAVFFDAMLHEPEMAFKAAGKFLGAYGYAIIEGPTLDFEDRPEPPNEDDYDSGEEYEWALIDYENAKRQWNPIRIRCPHPATVLLDPGERIPTLAVRYDMRYARDLRRMLDTARERDRKPEFVASEAEASMLYNGDPWEMHEVTDYWDKKQRIIVLGNQPLLVEKNLLGFVPYTQAFTGFGIKTTGDSRNDPYYLAQGLLDPILDDLTTQAQAWSARHNALIERAYMRLATSEDAAEVRDQLASDEEVVEIDPNRIKYLEYPQMDRAMFQSGQELEMDIEAGTFSAVVSGQRQQGVSTVGQHAMQTTAANRKFANPNKQLNLMATIVGQNTLRLVDRYGEVIEIMGKRLDPKQIHRNYTVTAEFQTFDPVLQLQEREVGMREHAQGLISDETYRERASIADETEEKKRLLKERVMKRPAVEAMLEEELAKEWGILDALENLEAADGPQVPDAGGRPAGEPQISDMAGGGATRGLRQALNGQTSNPPHGPLPPNPLS